MTPGLHFQRGNGNGHLQHLAAGGILEQSWEAQLLELEARLAASDARWKLVVGHHPVRNQHAPQNTPELVQHLEPILEAQVSLSSKKLCLKSFRALLTPSTLNKN